MQSVAYAVIRDDPPELFVADDLDTLNWVLALKLIARTRASDLSTEIRDRLRAALLAEQWGEAVQLWMRVNPGEVDVYPSHELYVAADVDFAAEELQFTPLFQD